MSDSTSDFEDVSSSFPDAMHLIHITKDTRMIRASIPTLSGKPDEKFQTGVTDCPIHIKKLQRYVAQCETISEYSAEDRTVAVAITLEKKIDPRRRNEILGPYKGRIVACCSSYMSTVHFAETIDRICDHLEEAIVDTNGEKACGL